MLTYIVTSLAMASGQALLLQLIQLLVVGFALYVIYWLTGIFGGVGALQKIIGLICLCVLIYAALKIFGVS